MNKAEQFRFIHDEIHREHELISHRMSWYVTSQAFLLTAFVASFNINSISWIKPLFPLVGMVISALIWISIWAALFAMKGYRKKWFEFLNTKSFSSLPFGKPKKIHYFGISPAAFIPVVFMLAWVWIFTQL